MKQSIIDNYKVLMAPWVKRSDKATCGFNCFTPALSLSSAAYTDKSHFSFMRFWEEKICAWIEEGASTMHHVIGACEIIDNVCTMPEEMYDFELDEWCFVVVKHTKNVVNMLLFAGDKVSVSEINIDLLYKSVH